MSSITQPRYVTSHRGQLSLLPSLGQKMSTSHSAMMLCGWQGHADSKTLLQQNPAVLNWECQLTQVVLYNGRKGCMRG